MGMLLTSRGDGIVVSVLSFYSDNPSWNPAEVFSVKFAYKKECCPFKKYVVAAYIDAKLFMIFLASSYLVQ